MNQLTHYLDASAVYGSTKREENDLRLLSDGLLKVTQHGNRRPDKGLLPPNDEENGECDANKGLDCFKAGKLVQCTMAFFEVLATKLIYKQTSIVNKHFYCIINR